jgi:uncharacterized protein YggT (Ycf19 family)
MADPTTRTAADTEAARAARAPSPAWSPGERNLFGQRVEPAWAAPAAAPAEARKIEPIAADGAAGTGAAAGGTEKTAASKRTGLSTGVSPTRRAMQMIWLLWLVSDLLVALRLILKAVGANENAGFVSFIYGAAGPLVAPFRPMVSDQGIGSNGVLEYSSIIAIAVFLAAALILTAFLRIVSAPRLRAAA